MIAFLRGTAYRIGAASLILDTGSVGYEVFVGTRLLSMIEEEEEVLLFTYQHIKEDAQTLYGFEQESELRLFQELLTVSGVGPKLAMVMMSSKSTREIISAIAYERPDVLTEVSGIGAKTAKRMVLELKDRMLDYVEHADPLLTVQSTEHGWTDEPRDSGAVPEALLALEALGYRRREVERALHRVASDQPDAATTTLVTEVLRILGS